MLGGAAGLQLHRQGAIPTFRLTELTGLIILLRCAENQPKGLSSYC